LVIHEKHVTPNFLIQSPGFFEEIKMIVFMIAWYPIDCIIIVRNKIEERRVFFHKGRRNNITSKQKYSAYRSASRSSTAGSRRATNG